MESIFDLLAKNIAVEKFEKNQGRLVNYDALSLAYLTTTSFIKNPRNIAIVCPNLFIAQNVYEIISSIIGEDNILLFPMDEIFHETSLAYSREMVGQRLYVLHKALEDKPKILITHTVAATRYLPSKEEFLKRYISLEKGKSYNIKDVVNKLLDASFLRVNKIDQSLQFALRGDILDIFPINEEMPIRIEFFDDEIESIRYFDIASQLSIKQIDRLDIFPSNDLFLSEEEIQFGKEKILYKLEYDVLDLNKAESERLREKVLNDIKNVNTANNENIYRYFHYFFKKANSVFDFFYPDTLVLYQYDELISSTKNRFEQNERYIKEMFQNGLSLNDPYFNMKLEDSLKANKIIKSYTYAKNNEDDYFLNIRAIPFVSRNLNNSINMIQEYLKMENKVVVCLDETNYKLFSEYLFSHNLEYAEIEGVSLPKENLSLLKRDLSTGFTFADENIVYLTKREIFGYKTNLNAFSARFKKAVVINSFDELKIGDYIVHEINGIGRYEGIVTLDTTGTKADYLKIQYAEKQILYVPLSRYSVIRKYVSNDGKEPRLSKLGGKDWSKAKDKIKEKVNFLAERLISLYAKRESTPGYAFPPDDELQKEFEDSFPYELTVDQVTAIREIKKDMEKNSPMDRLLCGDVGFGKTEVAFRAAFKAILAGKQVALLCPTTILAKQHYDVAINRFALFGINIALFSRFVPLSVQKENIEKIKNHQIDLIIGTHRILSEDIKIANLGLLIVDEEQRFGVEAKEKIKEITTYVDVLSLSATPIPRTLQMSLLGIRNLSQLNTAPRARMPIQTYVLEHNNNLIKDAIERELSRGGQIYYIHNSVSTIASKARFIQKLVPSAVIGAIHARMDKEDIDKIMTDFYAGNINVLVTTTIVEAGLDVPNANTMIIENADLFGLSQLYQIKGRVGRSNRVAYAYLLYNQNKELNEDAKLRLEAIKEFTELGSGIKIAQKDLKIRGAGDILGSEQSGFINTLGVDMYFNILEEVIKEKKGIKNVKKYIKPTNITIGGYIPRDYAIDSDKIQIYQEIENCVSIYDIEMLRRKIRDIYGRLPLEVEKILTKRKIDILASAKYIESLYEESEIVLVLTKAANAINGLAKIFTNKLEVVSEEDISIKFVDRKINFKIRKNKNALANLLSLLEVINSLND